MDDAARFADGVDLLVRKIARRVRDGADVGVAGDHRRLRAGNGRQRGGLRRLRHVHHAAQRIDPVDSGEAERRQAVVRVRLVEPRRRVMEGTRGIREVVVREMVEREHARACIIERVDCVHVALQRPRILEAEDQRRLACRSGCEDFIRRLRECHGVGVGRGQRLDRRELCVRLGARFGACCRRARTGADSDGHHHCADFSRLQLGRIDLRCAVRAEEVRRRRRHHDVRVGVQHQRLAVDDVSLLNQLGLAQRRILGRLGWRAGGEGEGKRCEKRPPRYDKCEHHSTPSKTQLPH